MEKHTYLLAKGKIGLSFLTIFLLSATILNAQPAASKLPARNQRDRLGYFQMSRRYNDVIRRGAFVVDLPEEGRFLVFFIPSAASLDKLMILLHGTGGTAYDETADEIAMAEEQGYATMAIQWLDKKTNQYDDAFKINRMIDKGMRFLEREFSAHPSRIALCGFSRGSVTSFQVAYLDQKSTKYIDMVIAHSGGIPFDSVVAPGESQVPDKIFSELASGKLGRECFKGIDFYLYAGEQDEEWGTKMAEYMRYTADLVTKNGGRVVRLNIDPQGRHAGYRQNRSYQLEAIKYFLNE